MLAISKALLEASPLFTYDDLLIEPGRSELDSRMDADIYVEVHSNSKSWSVLPVMAASMMSITTQKAVSKLANAGIIAPVHRNQSIEDALSTLPKENDKVPRAMAIGIKEPDRTEAALEHCDVIFLELAHAHNNHALSLLKELRKRAPDMFIVAGNIATAEAAMALADAGVSAVKVGIGNGGVCTTRLVTGCGVPQAYALYEIKNVIAKHDYNVKIIADGGLKTTGDIMKALAIGADFVMSGALFAGCKETTCTPDGKALYFGMASNQAGKVTNGYIAEGVSAMLSVKNSVDDVIHTIKAGLKQGVGLAGARSVSELYEKTKVRLITRAAYIEGLPHFLLNGGEKW